MLVYCKKCKFLCKEGDFQYDRIKIRNSGKKIFSYIPLCSYNIKITKKEKSTPVSKYTITTILVDDPWKLNRDKNCEHYTEKFIVKIIRRLRV